MTNATPDLAEQAPATEPIYQLLRTMAPRRSVLLGIMAFCETPQSLETLNDEVDRLQAHNASVYNAASLCMALEAKGALERVTEDGTPYAEVDLEPIVVEDEDGTSHYETPETPALFWLTTEGGRAVLAAEDPVGDARALLDEEKHLFPIYHRVLTLCDAGCTTAALGRAVDSDPLVQDPRLFAGHFVERLESAGCLAWTGEAWHATDLGRTIATEIAEA